MKIRRGNFVLNSDDHNFFITEFKPTIKTHKTKDENVGKIREVRVSGYYSTASGALSSAVSKKMMESDATSLEELVEHISGILQSVELITKALVELDKRVFSLPYDDIESVNDGEEYGDE